MKSSLVLVVARHTSFRSLTAFQRWHLPPTDEAKELLQELLTITEEVLHRVVMSHDYGSLLTFMLEAGADPNKQCWTGDTAWDTAHETNNPDDNVDTLGILRRFAVEEIPHEDTDSDSD
jgi:hypothetical protein